MMQRMHSRKMREEQDTICGSEWRVLFFAQRARVATGDSWSSVTDVLVDWSEARRMYMSGLKLLSREQRDRAQKFLHGSFRLVPSATVVNAMIAGGIDRPDWDSPLLDNMWPCIPDQPEDYSWPQPKLQTPTNTTCEIGDGREVQCAQQ